MTMTTEDNLITGQISFLTETT